MSKKYYWLKLHNNFFRQGEIKKMRTLEHGDLYTLIYLKLQLLSITTGGYLTATEFEESFAQDLALEIDETTEDVKNALAFLEKYRLIKMVNTGCLLLTKVAEVIGGEAESTARVRRMRAISALQCNGDVTKCNTEIEKELEQEIQLELDSELEKDLEPDPEKELEENDEVSTPMPTPAYYEASQESASEIVTAKCPITATDKVFTRKKTRSDEIFLQAEEKQEAEQTMLEMQVITERILSKLKHDASTNTVPVVVDLAVVIPVESEENFFEDFWQNYPKVYDRKNTFELWKQALARGIEASDLIFAAKKYALQVKSKQTLARYISSPSNFLLHNKFWEFLPIYLPSCPNCQGKGTFSKANLAGEDEYYHCACQQRYQDFPQQNLMKRAGV